MNLVDTAFIELLSARTLTIKVETKAAVESLRIMLYRKLQAHIAQWDAIGYLSDDLSDTTISVAMDKKKQIATLSIVKRKPKLQFTILSAGTSDHEEVSTDLEHNQSCEVQHRGADSDSSQHVADTDSGSSQGESNGQCVETEDWESLVRSFIAEDSGPQD